MGQEDNKSAQDDQAWFDALSGKTHAGQATRLRRMLREIELADAAQEDTTHDWQRLQFALRREEAKPAGKKRYSEFKYYALAASVLIVAGTISLLMPWGEVTQQSPQEAASVMRGAAEQVLFSADPAQDATQLEAELRRLGVKVTRRAMAEKIELHILLAYPVSDEVRAVLEARVIPVPDQGDLTVMFIKSN